MIPPSFSLSLDDTAYETAKLLLVTFEGVRHTLDQTFIIL